MNRMDRRGFLRACAVGAASAAVAQMPSARAQTRPNILLMVGDDIGFADIGCYGSEIQTPNLDRLAEQGMRFRQFYNMSKCEPTRSSLLTGLYFPRKNAENVMTFPSLLRDAGYYTAVSGKEHFASWVPKRCYAAEVFDDSFVYRLINSYFVPPSGKFENPFKLNGVEVPVEELPVYEPPLYKTDVVTDYALKFLDKAKESGKPFFLYLPFHPGHYPLQAREEDIAKYRGTYKIGWDELRKRRLAKQKAIGLLPEDTVLSPPEGNINKSRGPYRGNIYAYRPWDTLDAKEQDDLDLEMAVYAAMLDRMDQNIGRVLAKLEEMGALDNTLIMYFSDNGACPYDANKDFAVPPGGPDSYRSLCAAWANAGGTPFRYFKQYGHEGGARTQFIVHWPGVVAPGTFCDAPAHLVDLYPSLLEITGARYPADTDMPALDGASLVPLLKGGSRSTPKVILSGHTEKLRMVRAGDYKIVRVNGEAWELYNIEEDPTELHNLAESMPEKLAEIERLYKAWQEGS